MAAPLVLIPEGIPVLPGPGPLADEHREATQRLVGMMATQKEPVLVLISGIAGDEGVSKVAASVTRSLQHVTGRQIVHFRLSNSEDLAKPGGNGVLTQNMVRKLLAQGMRDGVGKLAPGCDLVVIETLPLLTSVESLALCPHADCVILVAKGDRTTYEQVREAQQAVERSGGKLLGVILNDRQYRVPTAIARIFGVPAGRRRRRGGVVGMLAAVVVAGVLIWAALTYGGGLVQAVDGNPATQPGGTGTAAADADG